jgi:hypothetical protein
MLQDPNCHFKAERGIKCESDSGSVASENARKSKVARKSSSTAFIDLTGVD